jgi:hypothetical protein
MNSKKNVIVVSARRGGTHLLVDLIVNNFGYESINKNYLDYTKFEWPGLNGFQELIDAGNKVTWTHSHNYRNYSKHNHSIDLGDDEKLDKIYSESKIILIYRDIRDIMTSCYHRPHIKSKYTSFSDFYENFDFDGYETIDKKHNNFSDLLIDYYKNWFSVYMSKELLNLDMEIISFEEIINEYDSSVNKIAKFLGQSISKPVDVRLPNENNTGIKYTTHDFRSGQVGTWIDTIGVELGNKIASKYHRDLGAGVECYLKDIKINRFHVPERDKFQRDYKDWNLETGSVNAELAEYSAKLEPFDVDTKQLIKDRYTNSKLAEGDFRYYHKVFYYKDYVLKFIYPCKAVLDKVTFNTTIPASSIKQQLVILKTNEVLYNLGIVPKLYDVGIYNGVLFAIQERYEGDQVLCAKYDIYPDWEDWKWPVDIGVYSQILEHFNAALEHNILLTDIVNVYNCALDDEGNLKYFDLDGIKLFDSREELLASEDYKNAMGILDEVNKHYLEKEETFNTNLV